MSNSVPAPVNVHGTCIALSCAGHTAGVLLQGASGTGKSSLALCLIDQPGFGAGTQTPVQTRLVSDDQTQIELVDGILTATAPQAIDRLLEVRGIGLVKTALPISPVQLDMVISHANVADIDRLPEPRAIELAGQALPMHTLDFSNPLSAAQVRTLALVHWGLLKLSNR